MYQVVEFKSSDGGGVGVVSKIWMSPKKTNCRWPNTKRPIDKKILHLIPDDTWKTYGVNRIFYATDDLLKARDRAKRAEIESEFSANSNEGSPMIRKREHVRSYYSQNSSSDEGIRDSDNISFPPTPSFLRNNNTSPSSSASSAASASVTINHNDSAEETAKSSQTFEPFPTVDSLDLTLKPTSKASGPLDVISRHLAHIENSLKELKLTQNEILERLRSASANTPASTLPDGTSITIPCNDLQSLQALESALVTAGNDKLLENYLSFVGGHKTSAIIRRILEKVFTNDLALICNWTGKNNKTALKNLNVVNVIKGAARRHKISELATDAEINTCISNWFRFTKDRDGGREKRRTANTTIIEKN